MLVGIDVIENDRFARAIKRRPRLLERLFTASEREYCHAKADPPKHFAARFAAKEAVGKALGTGVRSWQDIEIAAGAGGRPDVEVSGVMREAAARAGAGPIAVSLSHCGPVSVAVAAAAPEGTGDLRGG